MATFGPVGYETVILASGSSSIAVNTTDTVYTQSIKLKYKTYFSVFLSAVSSAGTVKITVQIEQSFVPPATEGASDGNFVIPNGMSDIVTDRTTESTVYAASISPIVAPYIRFKITGGNTNNADTIVSMVMCSVQEI